MNNTQKDFLKSGGAGLLAGIVMFIPMMIAVNVIEIAPFNVPPSGALLISQGLPAIPGAPILHFGYAIFAGLIFYAIFKNGVNVTKAIGLAAVMWLIMQLVLSPLIGWGFFGTQGQDLPADNPLHLGPTPKYLVITAALHLIYALVLGFTAKKIIAPHAHKASLNSKTPAGNI